MRTQSLPLYTQQAGMVTCTVRVVFLPQNRRQKKDGYSGNEVGRFAKENACTPHQTNDQTYLPAPHKELDSFRLCRSASLVHSTMMDVKKKIRSKTLSPPSSSFLLFLFSFFLAYYEHNTNASAFGEKKTFVRLLCATTVTVRQQ